MTDQIPLDTPLFLKNSSTLACEPYQQTGGTDDILWRLEAVPPETFVAMHEVNRARHADMDAVVREGDDGSWQVLGFFDKKRGAPCMDFTPLVAPYYKCLPPFQMFDGHYGDASCETRVTEVRDAFPRCATEAPMALMDAHYDEITCPPAYAYELYEVGEQRSTETYALDDSSGMCVGSGDPPIEAYVQGARIDAATLPTLEPLSVGTGEVTARFLGFGGVPFMPVWRPPGPFFEAATGLECRPLDFADGTLRCVATSFGGVGSEDDFSFEGASCTGPRVFFWSPTCPDDAPEPRGVTVIGEDPTCGNGVVNHVLELTGPSTSSTFSRSDLQTGECVAVDLSNAGSTTPYVVGEALDPDDVFPSLERTIRN
jgi:hypothetical protein